MLEKERQVFSDKHAELISQHPGQFIVIKDEEIIGAFNTIDDALAEGARRFGLQPFLVRQVTESVSETIDIPALTLGILRADSTRPI
ncbi:MAG: DUF5678 domain-containing protein [Blastocatellia bacterium]|nr:DUF5678 domain-containing protein [Blastocatellia bacterium]